MPRLPVLLILVLSGAAPVTGFAQPGFLVRDVRVFDGFKVAEHRSVLVEAGRIARIGGPTLAAPTGVEIIDGRRRTLLPGLIDAHVHLSDSAEADLRQAISLGVTTVFDMFSGGSRLERIKALRAADPPSLADVRTAGTGATRPGGHPSQMGGPPLPTIEDSTDADRFVAERFAEGSDFLKIIFDDLSGLGLSLPMLERRTLAGLIAAAHARRKLAVVHIQTESQARTAVDAGADGLVHLFPAGTVGADFATVVSKRGTFVVPTLTMLYGLCGRPNGAALASDPLLRPYVRPTLRRMLLLRLGSRGAPPRCEGTDQAIRELARRRVPILAGTDSPVPGQTYGASLHGELVLFGGLGLTPIAVLATATSAPARAFGLVDRGRIAPGLRADLLLVDGDPTTDLLATRRIVAVWKRGIRVDRTRYPEE